MQIHRFWDVARKAGVAVVGVAATALSMGALKSPWNEIATAVVAVGTYLGVYATKNVTQPPAK